MGFPFLEGPQKEDSSMLGSILVPHMRVVCGVGGCYICAISKHATGMCQHIGSS